MENSKDKTGLPKPKPKERLTLYKEYRLIERNETEISGSWKGILTFFLNIGHILFICINLYLNFCRLCCVYMP